MVWEGHQTLFARIRERFGCKHQRRPCLCAGGPRLRGAGSWPTNDKTPHALNVGRRVANCGLDVYPLKAKLPRSVFLNRDSFPFTEISRMIAL